MNLRTIPTDELNRELDRRSQTVEKLTRKRDQLLRELENIDQQLAGSGAGGGANPRRTSPGTRPRNSMTLGDALAHLKGWVAGAYYSSEMGMKELGWTGDTFFEGYPGCTHPEGHA